MKTNLTVVIIIFVLSLTGLSQDSGKGKLSGYFFGDYFYNLSRDAEVNSIPNKALNGEKDFNGIQFRRIYFTYDYTISNEFSSRFRLEADQSALTSSGKIGVFVKDAYLKWEEIFDSSDLIAGIQPTPAFEISEKYWGYRSIEKTIMDLRGIVSSRDAAVSLKGNLFGGGKLNYWIMYGNGSGNNPEIDKYKRFYAHLSCQPDKNFLITLYGDLKVQPAVDDPGSSASPKSTLNNNIVTTALFAGYKIKDKFSFGAEAFYQSKLNEIRSITLGKTKTEDKNALGVSLFASHFIGTRFSLFARFDYYDPNINSDYTGDSRNLIIAGLAYTPHENVSIMPNIMIETYEKPLNNNSVSASVTPRITFFFAFL